MHAARLLCPWDSLGKNIGGDCYALLQGIFLTQGSNPHLLRGRRILYHGATREVENDDTAHQNTGNAAKLVLTGEIAAVNRLPEWCKG